MTTGELITFYCAVTAWDAVCLQLFIIPFYKKAEMLHKDYITDGALDAVISFIETQKLIPALSKIFVRAQEAQTDRRRTINEEDFQQLLQEVNYLPDLEEAQKAMNETNVLNSLFDSLQNSARRLWKWGLLHIILVILIPTCCFMPNFEKIHCRLDRVGIIVITTMAIMVLIATIKNFCAFDNNLKKFLNLLKENRQK